MPDITTKTHKITTKKQRKCITTTKTQLKNNKKQHQCITTTLLQRQQAVLTIWPRNSSS